MAKKDYYNVLGVRRDASDKEIKQTYRRLARQYHPDVNPGDASAEQKFKEISEAYAVLSNPDSRKKYDRFGHQAFASGFDPGFARGGGFGGGQPGNFRDFFGGRTPFDGLNSLFEELWGSGGRQRTQQAPVSGQDLEQTVDISFEESVRGTTAQVQVMRRDGGGNACKSKSLLGSIRVPKYGQLAKARPEGTVARLEIYILSYGCDRMPILPVRAMTSCVRCR